MANTSKEARAGYEAYIPILQGMAELGDTSSLKERMQEKADYNKGILDAQAGNLEQQRQTEANYRWVNNPALEGYGINDRARLKEQDVANNRREANALGLYYTARQGDLANAITAWKDAWQAKYNGAQEGAKGAQTLYEMLFGEEKQQEDIRQFNAQQAQAMAIAQMQERGANSRAAASSQEDKETPGLQDWIKKFALYDGLGWGDTAKELSARGYDVRGGSIADRLLRETYMGKDNIGTWTGVERGWQYQ